MSKYPRLNSIKLNNFSPNASFKTLIAHASFSWPTNPISSIMDCIATNACERRGVGWQMTKYPKLNSIFGHLSPQPPAFTCICCNAIHYAWDGVCGSRETCTCNKGLNEAFGEKLFNFMLFSLGYLLICHPTPPPPHQTIIDFRFSIVKLVFLVSLV